MMDSNDEKRTCNNDEENVMPTMDVEGTRSCERDSRRREMMMKIRELSFAVLELALYLDTHPDDRRALCLHNNYAKELKELKDKYQKVYGPLTLDFPCNKWRWIEEPWPWERGNY